MLPYKATMDELFVHLQPQKLPKVVHTLLGVTLQNPIKLMCLVGNSELTSGTPRVESGLYASDLLIELLQAVRALDWELVANCLAHAIPPLESDEEITVTPEMIEAGEEVILSETGGAGAILSGHFCASALAERVYRAMRLADSEKQ